MRVHVPVAELEFETEGNTLWVHNNQGQTVLRIKTFGKIEVRQCDSNPCSHSDIIADGDIKVCLAADARQE